MTKSKRIKQTVLTFVLGSAAWLVGVIVLAFNAPMSLGYGGTVEDSWFASALMLWSVVVASLMALLIWHILRGVKPR